MWQMIMMKEAINVRQIKGEPRRRWFSDDYFELIVWYHSDDIWGFQLCYDMIKKPRALTWTKDSGFSHNAIDDGDDPSLGHKKSPVLTAGGVFERSRAEPQFDERGKNLPVEIRLFVQSRLYEFK